MESEFTSLGPLVFFMHPHLATYKWVFARHKGDLRDVEYIIEQHIVQPIEGSLRYALGYMLDVDQLKLKIYILPGAWTVDVVFPCYSLRL